MADKECSPAAVGIESLVEEIARDEGFSNPEIKKTLLTTDGANYMGELYIVDVEEADRKLNLFAKVTNIPAEARALIAGNEIFKNETYMYTEVAKEFEKLQEKYDIPEDVRFRFPKYYGSNLKDMEEILILENLSAKEYQVVDRKKTLDWNYFKVAVEELAKYHALGFALKMDKPETFETVANSIKNSFIENVLKNPEFPVHMMQPNVQAIEEENRGKVIKYINDNKDKLLVKLYAKNEHSVFTHGDYRSSNIMVKYQEDSIIALKPIDYQTAGLGNPITDILYLLFTGSDETFRLQYFDQFIKHYHDSMAKFLEQMNLDVEEIYPKSKFYLDLRENLSYGLELALCLLPAVLVETQDKIDMGDLINQDVAANVFSNMKLSDIYVERLNGIVRDFVRWGVLNNDSTRQKENEMNENVHYNSSP